MTKHIPPLPGIADSLRRDDVVVPCVPQPLPRKKWRTRYAVCFGGARRNTAAKYSRKQAQCLAKRFNSLTKTDHAYISPLRVLAY